MNKREIYIPIEVKPREFISQVFLSGELARNGARVYIGSKTLIKKLIDQKKNNQGVYFYKGGGGSIKKFRDIYPKVNSIAVLDQELSPAIRNYDYIKMRFMEGSIKYVSRHYFIGKNMREQAIKYLKDIIPSTTKDFGWPRVDLWQTSKHYISNDLIKKIHDEYGENFILFSSDFGINSQKLLDERSIRIELLGVKKTQEQLKLNKEKMKDSYNKFKKFIDFLHEIDSDNRIPPIIIRPHPAEDHDAWKINILDLKKIKLVFDGEITPWLLASKGLLHRGCTTGVQSFISEKKTGFLSKFADKNNKSISSKVSANLNNLDELVEWIEKSSIEPNYKLNKDILENEITFLKDGATKHISEDMIILAGEPVKNTIFKDQSMLKKIYEKFLILLKSKLLKKKQPFKLGNLGEFNKMLDGIRSEEIKSYLTKMYPQEKFKVNQSSKNLCCIEKLI